MVFYNSPNSLIQPTQGYGATPINYTNRNIVPAVSNTLSGCYSQRIVCEIIQDTSGRQLAVPVPWSAHITRLLPQPIPSVYVTPLQNSHPHNSSNIPLRLIFYIFHHNKAFQKADLILFDSHTTREKVHQINVYLAKHVNMRWLYSASFKSSCCASLVGFLIKRQQMYAHSPSITLRGANP